MARKIPIGKREMDALIRDYVSVDDAIDRMYDGIQDFSIMPIDAGYLRNQKAVALNQDGVIYMPPLDDIPIVIGEDNFEYIYSRLRNEMGLDEQETKEALWDYALYHEVSDVTIMRKHGKRSMGPDDMDHARADYVSRRLLKSRGKDAAARAAKIMHEYRDDDFGRNAITLDERYRPIYEELMEAA
jgi:hypothetical protein